MRMAISMFQANLESDRSYYNELFLMLSHVKPFVQWESLSGVPYIRIRTIVSTNRITNSYAFIKEADELLRHYLTHFNFYYDYYTNEYKIIFDQQFHDVVIKNRLEEVKDKLNQVGYNEIYGSIHENQFISGAESSISIPEKLFDDNEWNFIEFKGQIYKNKIYAQEGKLDTNNLTYNKKLESYVKQIAKTRQQNFKNIHEYKTQCS